MMAPILITLDLSSGFSIAFKELSRRRVLGKAHRKYEWCHVQRFKVSSGLFCILKWDRRCLPRSQFISERVRVTNKH